MSGEGLATATIDLDALRANAALAARLAGDRHVVAVVKADAYGHGALPVARVLEGVGCAALATWSVDEAVVLRDGGIRAPLLVLAGLPDAASADACVARELTPVLGRAADRARLVDAVRRRGAGPVAVHVEIDTGMHRMGLAPEDAREFLGSCADAAEVRLAGVMTHFARADEADLGPTREQLRRFDAVLAPLRAAGFDPGWVHAANSAGLVALEELAGEGPEQDAVRPGLLLYGAQPSAARPLPLRPVMTLRAPVVALRRVAAGEAVGYGGLFRAEKDTRVATLGVGYADGFPVAASGVGEVWLGGARRRVLGRVSMDSIGVEVGDAPVSVGDQALCFGADTPGEAARLTVDAAAEAASTISYELLVRVGSRVRRAYCGDSGGDAPDA